jgi:hypothetical protein
VSQTRAQTSRIREGFFRFLDQPHRAAKREGSLGTSGVGCYVTPHTRQECTVKTLPDDSFHVFDTTLRDGAQREGINLSVADKLAIARHLDEFGVGFIEGGWPGANPRDTEFFERARDEIDFRHAQLVACGPTRTRRSKPCWSPGRR